MTKKQVNKAQTGDDIEQSKKSKLFSAKEFRKQISSEHALRALQGFLEVIKNSEKHDYILEYLENGGSSLELLQTLEVDSTISPTIVFEILTYILLKISSSLPKYQSAAYESCRFILNNYITVINKMINFSSSTPERKACLKLLTAMVAFSPVLAKDILIHVNFHSANVELLTKQTGEKDSVRDNFIKFLTAYLIDGHYPALSVLLEKKGFFTSIISGLKFDNADTLCLVISAMKAFILENPSVSKTAKMKTFNTIVIKDIVNLYNWKGPAGFKAVKKYKKTAFTVDEVEKSKVNEVLHQFLLTLCTSHRYGIIFKDHTVGLGKKNQNPLMFTVLDSLERPWDHSYASELVIKICGACPDLTKTLWNNLKTSLEPRMSPKWVSAVKFAINLIKELQPSSIDFCIKELNEIQLLQIVQCLVLPLPILKTIIPQNATFDSPSIKQYILSLLWEMLKSVQQFLIVSKNYFSQDKQAKFELYVNKHVLKNLPDATKILTNWNQLDTNCPFTEFEALGIIVDILNYYKTISPDLLDSLSKDDTILSNLLFQENSGQIDQTFTNLQVKVTSLFMGLDHSKFRTNSNMFSFVVPLLFKIYYNNPDGYTLNVLNKLFKNTGIFDGCEYEINIWINGILDMKHFDESLALNILDILKITDENIHTFLEELSLVQSEASRDKHCSEIIKNLIHQTKLSNVDQKYPIKHKYLSPLIIGLSLYLSKTDSSKALKTYTNFVIINLLHLQTKMEPITYFINKIDLLSSSFKEYAAKWLDCQEILSLKKSKGRLKIFEECSKQFLFGDIDQCIKNNDLNAYLDVHLNLFDMIIFYLTNLVNNEVLTLEIVERCEKFVKIIINENDFNPTMIERILCNPVLISHMNFLELNKQKSKSYATKCLVDITKYLLDSNANINIYLNIYREILLNSVLKAVSEPEKYVTCPELKTLLQIYNLGYNECHTILKTLSLSYENHTKYDLSADILTYSLKQFTNTCVKDSKLESLEKDIFSKLTQYISLLAKNQSQFVSTLSPVFLEYLKIFPHSTNYIGNNLFKSLIELDDLNKDNIKLAAFLLHKKPSYAKYVKKNINSICEKKVVLLPLLNVLSKQHIEDEFLNQIYDLILASLTKTIQKPQKVGQHFHEYYQGLVKLIEVAMPEKNCKTFWDKVQKFDTTEVFHVHLLKSICLKCLNDSLTSREINNILLTFVHLQVNLFKKSLKSDLEISKAKEIVSQFVDILKRLKSITPDKDLKNIAKNETLKLYFKFCLKFGVSRQPVFLKALRYLIDILSNHLEKEDGRLILDMLVSHSEFLETVLGEYSETKSEILSLYLILCKTWSEFMERNFVPLLLASYRAQVNKSDRTILVLLKMFECKPEQTNFYDFKPFLWGKSAATHYSVRLQIESVLLRQPKVSDVLDILQEDLVISTIVNYPLKDHLRAEQIDLLSVDDKKSYDLVFLLPLFSQLLAPEQQVQTYKFTRSGALSLTVLALSSLDQELRQAACHVLSRFHYHVDAKQTGKDNLLWIRYVEAVCKGTALLPDFKLNNFAAIYLARMALILTQPNHVMYLPLSQHLTAKSSLDFSTVPELYTFLHSPDVNFKEHRNFTLELLRDGLRTEKDFTDFMRSMAFKLFCELYLSSVSDFDTKLLILDVVKSICEIPLGVKIICENASYLTQAYTDVYNILKDSKEKLNNSLINKLLEILLKIVRVMQDRYTNSMVFGIISNLILNDSYFSIIGTSENILFEIIFIIQNKFLDMFCINFFNRFLDKIDDSFCNYLRKYGCDFVNIEELDKEDKYYYIRVFVHNFLRAKGYILGINDSI